MVLLREKLLFVFLLIIFGKSLTFSPAFFFSYELTLPILDNLAIGSYMCVNICLF